MSFGKKRLTLAKDGIVCVYLVLDQFGFKKFNCDFLFVISECKLCIFCASSCLFTFIDYFHKINNRGHRPCTRITR